MPWDINNKSPNVSIDAQGRAYKTGGTNFQGIRAVEPIGNRKVYFEVVLSDANSCVVGVTSGAWPFTAGGGADVLPRSSFYTGDGKVYGGGLGYNGPGFTGLNKVIGVAIDGIVGNIHFSVDGVWRSDPNGAAPANGVTPIDRSTGLYPSFFPYYNNAFAKLNESEFVYPVPAGYEGYVKAEKVLLRINNELKKIDAGALITVVGEPTLENFNTHGFKIDLVLANLNILPDVFDVLVLSDDADKKLTLDVSAMSFAEVGENVSVLGNSSSELNIEIDYVPKPVLVVAKNSKIMTFFDKITDIELAFSISGNSVIKMVVSTDDGANWYGYNNLIWNKLTDLTVEQVNIHGITPSVFNNLNNEWNTIPGLHDNDQVKFAYLLVLDSYGDLLSTDQLSITYDATGYYTEVYQPDFDFQYTDKNQAEIKLATTGIYKINIC